MPTAEREIAVVYVTKSALARGIELVRVEIIGSTAFPIGGRQANPLGLAPKDWHRGEAAARARVLQMVEAKKKSFDKQRKKLEQLAADVAAGKHKVVDKTKGSR